MHPFTIIFRDNSDHEQRADDIRINVTANNEQTAWGADWQVLKKRGHDSTRYAILRCETGHS